MVQVFLGTVLHWAPMHSKSVSPPLVERRNALRDQLKFLADCMSKQPGYAYSSFYEYFLIQGKAMPRTKPTKTQLARISKAVLYIHPEQKQCFFNSQRLALALPHFFVYCEGYVMNNLGIAIHHAWNLAGQSGRTRKPRPEILVDATLRIDLYKPHVMTNLVVGLPPEGWEYWGRTFTAQEIGQRWDETGAAGSMVDRPDIHFAALKAG